MLLLTALFTGATLHADERALGVKKTRVITLATALERAEEYSERIETERLLYRAALRRHSYGIRDYFPVLELSCSGIDRVRTGSADTRSKELTLSVSQALFRGGRLEGGRRLRSLALDLKARELRTLREELADQTWNCFHQTLVLRRKKELHARSCERVREEVEIARRELELGRVKHADLLELELQLKALEISQQQLDAECRQAEARLRRLIHLPRGGRLQLSADPKAELSGEVLFHPLDYYLELAHRYNYELQRREYTLALRSLELAETERRMLPDIDLTGSLTLSGRRFPLRHFTYSIGLRLSFSEPGMPFSTALRIGEEGTGSRSRRISASVQPGKELTGGLDRKEARLRLRAAGLQRQRSEAELRFSIEEGLDRYRCAVEQLTLLRERVRLHRHRLEVVQQQFDTGKLTRRDLLEQIAELAKQHLQVQEQQLVLLRCGREIERSIGLAPGELQHHLAGEER
jgi:outer membrane protein TolC